MSIALRLPQPGQLRMMQRGPTSFEGCGKYTAPGPADSSASMLSAILICRLIGPSIQKPPRLPGDGYAATAN